MKDYLQRPRAALGSKSNSLIIVRQIHLMSDQLFHLYLARLQILQRSSKAVGLCPGGDQLDLMEIPVLRIDGPFRACVRHGEHHELGSHLAKLDHAFHHIHICRGIHKNIKSFGRDLSQLRLMNAGIIAVHQNGLFAAVFLQDPEKILEKCRRILEGFQDGEEDIVSVGVTGQMHGILYTDERGRAVSPLYTWQDRRGDLPCKENSDGKEETWAGELSRKTGYPAASGFGLVTHYYHVKNGTIPREAVSLCTIPDYIAMSLAGEKRPLIHQSMAASLGLYDLRESCFDQRAIEAAGMDPGILPEVTREHRIVGRLKESAGEGNQSGTCVVSVALGDNQASFLGSVGPEERLLLNVGTGSQISAYADRLIETREAECRPYLGKTWLIAGSPLCGP